MSLKHNVKGKSYDLDITSKVPQTGHRVWIVRILEETDHELTNCRVAGTWDDAVIVASNWLNSLCLLNPGKLLKYAIGDAPRDYDN